MKTPEDEAFDDIARRQGMWGGGFPAKRAMAADKLQKPWNEDEWRKNNWRCQHGWLRGEQCEICNAAQPAQEPVAFDKFLESQDFYELMQTYRHCLTDALLPFEEVKNALRAAHIGEMK